MLSRLDIPGFGKINVYNTHLCADCEEFERAEQIDVLLEFLNDLEENTGGGFPTILGGDFNFDRFRNDGEQRFQYEKIIDSGFSDAYAEYIRRQLFYHLCTYWIQVDIARQLFEIFVRIDKNRFKSDNPVFNDIRG